MTLAFFSLPLAKEVLSLARFSTIDGFFCKGYYTEPDAFYDDPEAPTVVMVLYLVSPGAPNLMDVEEFGSLGIYSFLSLAPIF